MKTAYWMMLGMLLTSALGSAEEVKPAAPPPPTPGLPPVPSALTPPSPIRRSVPVRAATPGQPPVQPVPVQPVSVQPYGQPVQQQIQVAPPRVPPSGFPSVAPGQVPGPLTALKWDAEQKEYTSKRGETEARFSFWLTNITSSDVSINSVRTSCGCTVAKLPSTPWVVPPAGGGPIEVTVNLAGKSGTITKAVTVESSGGTKSLLVKVNIDGGQPLAGQSPATQSTMNDAERLKNMQLALGDRQVLFKNQDCAKCHAEKGLTGMTDGRQIYNSACGVCHESHIRASMVPDLKTLTHPTDAEYWRNWINYGRAGSMMPAFAQAEGGPLNESQVNALVNFMVQAYPSRQGAAALQKSAALRSPSVVSPTVVSPTVTVPAH